MRNSAVMRVGNPALFYFKYAIDVAKRIVYDCINKSSGGDNVGLKAVRERAELTQEEAARKCDVSLTTIRKIEQTGYKPGSRIKRKICKGLRCKIEELEE